MLLQLHFTTRLGELAVCTYMQTNRNVHTALSTGLTCVVGESFVVHVKQEPSLFPGLNPPPSLGQKAGAAPGRQPQVHAAGHPVTQRLHVGAEVEVGGEEEWQAVRPEGFLQSDRTNDDRTNPDMFALKTCVARQGISFKTLLCDQPCSLTHLSGLPTQLNLLNSTFDI